MPGAGQGGDEVVAFYAQCLELVADHVEAELTPRQAVMIVVSASAAGPEVARLAADHVERHQDRDCWCDASCSDPGCCGGPYSRVSECPACQAALVADVVEPRRWPRYRCADRDPCDCAAAHRAARTSGS